MEKAILVGVDTGEDKDFDRSMDELKGLAEACDMEVAAIVTQQLPTVNKATYIGSGKVNEIKESIAALEAEMVILDNSLSPSQLRNLSDEWGIAVMDRSSLILEIFSRRAKTKEAKLQVEVASLQYMLPRLVGLHNALSRQGGGSGALSNKGSGEKQLELDRRYLEQRLDHLKAQLSDVEKNRRTQRSHRAEGGNIRVALVGYTNAGKSTLMNALLTEYTPAEQLDEDRLVYTEDMLFATLDTTVRRLEAPGHSPMLISDTVGFIDKLPHHLIKAFGSTLEEAAEADVILHVIDDSDEYVNAHIDVTTRTLAELGAGDIPTIIVHNKADISGKEIPSVKQSNSSTEIYISAKEHIGLEELLSLIEAQLDIVECTLLIPYSKGSIVNILMENNAALNTEYAAEGTKLTLRLSKMDFNRYKEYLI